MKKVEKGFTLIELLIVVLILGVLSALALLGYSAVMKRVRDSLARTRIFQVAEAQSQYRTALGRRRYATLSELAATDTPQGKLLSESVVKFDGGVSQPISDWVLEQSPGAPTDNAYLRFKFDLRIRPQAATANDKIYCIHEDAVEREGTLSGGCNRNSPAVER